MNDAEICLLAPVPSQHLQDAVAVLRLHKKVAFGTEGEPGPIAELLNLVNPADVFIYEALNQALPANRPTATWRARLIGLDLEGAIDAKYRPAGAAKEDWKAYWLIDCLQPCEPIPIANFSGYKSKVSYKETFVPRRPLIARRA